MWWMSGVVDVLFYPWCGGCLVWWMSGVVDVCVVDVVQSLFLDLNFVLSCPFWHHQVMGEKVTAVSYFFFYFFKIINLKSNNSNFWKCFQLIVKEIRFIIKKL